MSRMFEPRFLLRATGLTLLIVSATVAAGNDPSLCDAPNEAPDVIVGDLHNVIGWGSVGSVSAFSVGTTSCNVGTCELLWESDNNQHPVIGQGLFRLKDGRFEQVGQSWLKHGFFALSENLCSNDCVDSGFDRLGVNCSDPYDADLNGAQFRLGPKFEVNAYTGEFAYPPTDGDMNGDAIYKRMQVHNDDLDPTLNDGAVYFVEGHYVTADDAAAGNHYNNASYRQVQVSGSSGVYSLSLRGETQRTEPAVVAWARQMKGVRLTKVDVPGDGRFHVAARAVPNVDGTYRYEYAVHNLNSHRSAMAFAVPVPAGGTVTNVGFHDVEYHSGEPFDGTDWASSIVQGPSGPMLQWSTEDHAQNTDANALRWGTLYNFRFDLDLPPALGEATVGLFRPGTPSSVVTQTWVPNPCVQDGTCSAGENACNCPADCTGRTKMELVCDDGLDNDCDDRIDCDDPDCSGGACGQPLATVDERYGACAPVKTERVELPQSCLEEVGERPSAARTPRRPGSN
jgi:hypothetical protein